MKVDTNSAQSFVLLVDVNQKFFLRWPKKIRIFKTILNIETQGHQIVYILRLCIEFSLYFHFRCLKVEDG